MVEFDIDKAIQLTVSGIAAAFVALIALIAFTLLTRLVARFADRSQAKGIGSPVGTPPQAPEGLSREDSTDDDAELVAAAGTAVAMAMQEEESAGKEVEAAVAGGWKGYGRWQAFESRKTRNRQR